MSASEAGAVEAEPIDRAEHGRGDLFGAEEFLREDLHLLAGDRFNRSKNLVERIIAAEIELLASKVGHAGTGGLKRKHERSLEMILGAEQLFRANRGFLHGTKFGEGEIENFADGFFRGSGVYAEHSGIGVRRNFAEYRIGQATLFANILEKPRGHAAAKKIIQHRDAKATLVSDGERRNTDTEMNLFDIFFALDVQGSAGFWRLVLFQAVRRLQVAKLLLHQV